MDYIHSSDFPLYLCDFLKLEYIYPLTRVCQNWNTIIKEVQMIDCIQLYLGNKLLYDVRYRDIIRGLDPWR